MKTDSPFIEGGELTAEGKPWKHELGKRVIYPVDVFNIKAGFKHGQIVKRGYRGQKSVPIGSYGDAVNLGPYPELYVVKFDNEEREQEFFHGALADEA